MLDEPMRAQSRALLAGCVLAAVAVAGCAVLAFVRPARELGDAAIVMTKESGALYVRIGDTWHPALNLASARLIAGSPAEPVTVSESRLRGTKRGALLGIPGAPATLPAPLSDDELQWTVCDAAGSTTVIAGGLAAGSAALRGGQAVLVRGPSEPTTFLLYDGHRAKVDRGDVAVTKALNLDSVEPVRISTAVLNAIPEFPPIMVPAIASAGQRGPASLGDVPVGAVVRLERAGADEFFVVLDGGVQRVGPIAADIIRFGDSQGERDIATVGADAIGATPVVERLPVSTYPSEPPTIVSAPVVCAHWLPRASGTTVLTGQGVPLGSGQAPVALVQADGSGPNIDAVFVPPGRSVYTQASRRYLVADTGVRFGVADTESAAALGLPATAPAAPWPILKLLADGPELSRAGALVAHDGVAADPHGALAH